MSGDAGGQVAVQPVDQTGRELGSVLLGDEDVAVELLGSFQALLKGGALMADHESCYVIRHKVFKGLLPLLQGESFQIGGLHAADDLDAGGIEVIIKPRELHSRTVNVGSGDDCRFIIG